jgi:alkanesulfonate monooxygenase SsuD/methylene tetrahydromethanopterin reductase-like flavin-dependent oxidoreductase (luciferase family)
MPHARRFRFGVELHDPLPESSLLDTFRELEALGYSTVFFPDHFDEGPGPIAAMAAAVTVTSTLNVGSLVFDCDYRHPAVLSRELATIDHLSEGRLEVGLGAGWKRTDYNYAGIEMERPGVRVSRLIEHTTVSRDSGATGRSRSQASTTGSPSSTAHRSRSDPVALRSSSAAARLGCWVGQGPSPTSSA